MTDHRSRLLGQARADLVALPGLVDELSRCLTERPAVSGGGGGKPGSKAPLRLDVLHLIDERRKPGWEGEDPRLRDLDDRYGIAPMLESWTRVVVEEMDERPDLAEEATVRTEAALLVEHWVWVSQRDWADELAEDVRSVTAQVRSALGERKDYREFRPTCRSCGWKLTPMDESKWFACSACGRDYTIDADLKALGQVQDGTIVEISQLLTVPVATLHRWHKDRWLTPVGTTPRGKLFNIDAVRRVSERVRESATG